MRAAGDPGPRDPYALGQGGLPTGGGRMRLLRTLPWLLAPAMLALCITVLLYVAAPLLWPVRAGWVVCAPAQLRFGVQQPQRSRPYDD